MRIYEFVSLRECVGRLDEPNLTCAHSHTVVLINSTLLKTNLLAKLYQSWRQGKSLRDWIILPQVFTRNQGKYLELELVVPVVSEILLKTFSEIHQQDLNSILIKISTKEIILLWI